MKLITACEVRERCCHSTQKKNHSERESDSTGAELVTAFNRSSQRTASDLSQPQRNRNVYDNLLLGIKIACVIICSSSLFIPTFGKAK